MNHVHISSEGFLPHGHCFLWRPEILWTHVLSDLVIFLAYMSIPISLIIILRKNPGLQNRWILIMFSLFIFLCGFTHLVRIWTIWYPDYIAEGVVKAITAAISITTAILFLPMLPNILQKLGENDEQKK